MKNQEMKTENVTIINGAVITGGVIEYINMVQHENNSVLNEIRAEICNAVSLLIVAKEYLGDEIEKEIDETIKSLNLTSRNLKGLMKP